MPSADDVAKAIKAANLARQAEQENDDRLREEAARQTDAVKSRRQAEQS